MEYRRLGDSGLLVSGVGLGTNNFAGRLHDEAARAVLNEALELGVTFIDTADIYGRGSEEGLGASENQLGRLLAGRRQNVILATKFGHPMSESVYERGASRGWIVRAVEASLRRLRTDYIDLYQIHVPDPQTPIEETLRALDDLVRAGKVRWIGHSNFAAWQMADADWTARTHHLSRPISAQMHYNLLVRDIEAEVIPACRRFGLGVIPYFPLESGFLTGKYRPAGEGQGPAGRERARRRDPDRRQLPAPRTAGAIRGRTQAHAARPGVRMAAQSADRRLGHRQRQHARPGEGQRRRGRVAPERRRDGRGRRAVADRAASGRLRSDRRRGRARRWPRLRLSETCRRAATRARSDNPVRAIGRSGSSSRIHRSKTLRQAGHS